MELKLSQFPLRPKKYEGVVNEENESQHDDIAVLDVDDNCM